MRAFACVALVVACSPSTPTVVIDAARDTVSDSGPDPDDGARSGTRLKLTWFEFTDGTRQFDGFYDAERKEPCFISQRWTDGNAYCTPSAASVVYTNSTCTARVAASYHDP